MRKTGWISMIPLLMMLGACKKSERPFQTNPSQPGTYQQQGTDQGLERRGGERRGTDHEGAAQPGQAGEPGQMGRGTDHEGAAQPAQPGQMGEAGTAQQGETYRAEVPKSVKDFRRYADTLRNSSDMQHSQFINALRSLADAVNELPNGASVTANKDVVTRIRSYADRIEASGTQSNMHARWAKRALKEGVDALNNYATAQNVGGLAQRVQEVRGNVDKISDDKPFMDQKAQIADSMQQLADAYAYASAPARTGSL